MIDVRFKAVHRGGRGGRRRRNGNVPGRKRSFRLRSGNSFSRRARRLSSAAEPGGAVAQLTPGWLTQSRRRLRQPRYSHAPCNSRGN